MSPIEASKRIAAASAATQPNAVLAISGVTIAAGVFRGVVYVCVGFGVVSHIEASLWWAPVIAWGLSQTVGRAWNWWNRDALVKAYEEQARAYPKGRES